MILEFYSQLYKLLQAEKRLILMVVVANEGSSPGRRGFKMVISNNEMFGTIGGGIMEIKLVEYARSLLAKDTFNPFIKHQIHDKSAPVDQSGMICSGRQTVAFYDINAQSEAVINDILNGADIIHYLDSGISVNPQSNASEWSYSEPVSLPNNVYIIGGGHVGLALSEVLSRLDFEIHILDHRENLNTMNANTFAHHRQVVAFEEIENYVPEGYNTYVVIMSVGYRTDEIIISRLLKRQFQYIGLMGSKEKIATLKQHLLSKGFSEGDLSKVYMPIGIDIKSETTQEIAISVAAQLIAVKNRTKVNS
jgi:xanthine dehydrogenase accessory factor